VIDVYLDVCDVFSIYAKGVMRVLFSLSSCGKKKKKRKEEKKEKRERSNAVVCVNGMTCTNR
jgi:hypothetical protein